MSQHSWNYDGSHANVENGIFQNDSGPSGGGPTPLESKNDREMLLLLAVLVIIFWAAMAGMNSFVRRDYVINPGSNYFSWYGGNTITNNTSYTLHVHGDSLVNMMGTTGNKTRFPVCTSVVVDDKIQSVATVIDGVIHINGTNETYMTAGLYAACAITRLDYKTLDENFFTRYSDLSLNHPEELSFATAPPLTIQP